eukprot:831271_1
MPYATLLMINFVLISLSTSITNCIGSSSTSSSSSSESSESVSAFNQRRETLIDTALAGGSSIVFEAYRGVTLTSLDNALAAVAPTQPNADFVWNRVVRVLYFTHETNVIQQIFDAAVASQPFWVHPGDTTG